MHETLMPRTVGVAGGKHVGLRKRNLTPLPPVPEPCPWWLPTRMIMSPIAAIKNCS
jgi:hypothetical protein